MPEDRKENTLNLVLRLLIITVCAGLILGLVYGITKDPIAQQELKKATEARQTVLPAATDFEEVPLDGIDYDHEKYAIIKSVYKGTADGATVGYTYSLDTKGYKAGLGITVGISADGKVTGVSITSSDETAGLGANASKPEFLDQFKDTAAALSVTKNSAGENEIQALTGATITSKGVTNAVNTARAFGEAYLGEGAK